jgi:hypothetical protein
MTTASDEEATLTQFTDPTCTWCWDSVPSVRRLRTEYGERLGLRFVVGGLVEVLDEFSDAASDVSGPGDVAPHWLEAPSPPPVRRFVAEHGSVATREVAEVYGLDPGRARRTLESLVDDGHVRRERRGNGYFRLGPRGGVV